MPIVDTIQEEEKYGNDGNRPWDRAIVNTLEKVSVFGNNLIEVRIIIHAFFNQMHLLQSILFVEQLLYIFMHVQCTSHDAYRMLTIFTYC